MTTLTQKTLDFNSRVKLTEGGGDLSSDTGGILVREFDETIGFSRTLAQHLFLNDERHYPIHDSEFKDIVFKTLSEVQPYHWTAAYSDEDLFDE